MKILVLNAGSSSLKYSLFMNEHTQLVQHGLIEHLNEPNNQGQIKNHSDALKEVEQQLQTAQLIQHLGDCDAVGHRVVHGGERFACATQVTPQVIAEIKNLSALAPLHNPVNLQPIEFLTQHYPDLKQVAVFDTAFHQTLPDYAYHYALPETLYEAHHIRRYGFHGTSHQYIAKQLAEHLDLPDEEVHLISCHLGNGASICAIEGGESIDTSMGFTPLEGLIMGTRSGDLDPAIVLYLIKKLGYSADQVDHLLNHESGLKGICGHNDMREVIELANQGDAQAQLALDMFVYRINKTIGGYLSIMDEVDGIVFTGGIGEHAPLIREMILSGFASWYGININYEANETADPKAITRISDLESLIDAWVIPTNEELEIAQQTQTLVLSSCVNGIA